MIDVSGVEIMDATDWEALRRTMSMARIMGARPVITGLRPGVVSALVELGVDAEDVETAHTLDEGLERFEPEPPLDDLSGAEDDEEGDTRLNLGGDADGRDVESEIDAPSHRE